MKTIMKIRKSVWSVMPSVVMLVCVLIFASNANGMNWVAQQDEKVYEKVEQMPEFPGGNKALLSFIAENLKYPQKAIDEQTEGRVIVQFVIDKTGKVSSPEVIRGVTSELDQAALDIVSALPDWKPGEQDGQKVNVKYTLPVVFKLK